MDMPIHSVHYNDPRKKGVGFTPNPTRLQHTGPCIRVKVDIPAVLAQLLETTGGAIPASPTGWALIDTGAGVSAVDGDVLRTLGVAAIGLAEVTTASGKAIYPKYPARLSFPETPLPPHEFGGLLGADLSGYRLAEGPSIIALIGRDILRDFVLVYNGRDAMFTLAG